MKSCFLAISGGAVKNDILPEAPGQPHERFFWSFRKLLPLAFGTTGLDPVRIGHKTLHEILLNDSCESGSCVLILNAVENFVRRLHFYGP